MRILIDIGHPGHVHYFKHFIKIMKGKGHEILVTARDKDVTLNLLDNLDTIVLNRGKGGDGLIGKIAYLIKGDWFLVKAALTFKPDLFMSFGSTYAAHAAAIMRKPHIAYDDTEHAKFEHMLYVPFTDKIVTGKSFRKDFGAKKHVRINSNIKLAYLHPKYFSPSADILSKYQIEVSKPFFILRFVSWGASHDFGYEGISRKGKDELISKLSEKGNVYISSEATLPDHFKKYQLQIQPEDLHTVLACASLFVGEGTTTATEAALVGTPAIIVNKLAKLCGSLIEFENVYDILYSYDTLDEAMPKIEENLKDVNHAKKIQKEKLNILLANYEDMTSFMVDFAETYNKGEIQ